MNINQRIDEALDSVKSARCNTHSYDIEDLCLAILRLAEVVREVNAKVDAITAANEDDGK